jgi:glycosyltransferase involved in cell wall biosynthesis
LITELNYLNLPFCCIENSLPLSQYLFQDKTSFKPRILWMRSFHPIYNPLLALQVIQLILIEYPDAVLYMAGVDLGYQMETEKTAKEMGLSKSVIFPGFQDIRGKNHLASLCDLYMCTNRIDNTPVTLLEMMALGLPIVTTNVGGIPYMIKNNEALMVDSENPQQMANAILKILNEPSFSISMIDRGRTLVKTYDEDMVANKWVNLLQSL